MDIKKVNLAGLKIKKVDLSKVHAATKNLASKTKDIHKSSREYCENLSESSGFKVFVKTLNVVAIIIMIAITYFAVLIYGYRSKDADVKAVAKVVPYPVTLVNYDAVTYAELTHEVGYVHHYYNYAQAGIEDYTQIDQQIYDDLVSNKIVNYEAIIHHVKVTKADEDAAINAIIEGAGGQDKFEKALTDMYGLTPKQFRKLVHVRLVREGLDKAVITRVTASHILILADSSATPDAVAAAKTKIDAIAAEISAGLSFADAAKKYSEDTSSATNGGLLAPFAKGEMVDAFSDAAFSAKAGQVSAPVRTEYGWHLILVESKSGSIEEKFTDWIDSIKKKSLILKFYAV
ncbi:MAG: peptidylprolyl isomerase [Candidatus Berkelbacteria bacterium]